VGQMKYDFDKVYDRSNTDCIKWDLVRKNFKRKDVISMGIADMDFPVAEPILRALKIRAEHPFYGYTIPGHDVIEAVVERLQRKYGWKIRPEWIVFTPGVVPALHFAVRSLSHPGDEIILQQPVYHPFFPAVNSSGCKIVNNELKLIDNHYEMDYQDLESKFHTSSGFHASPNRIKAIIFCNPHNPIGRVWNQEEITRMGEIILRHGAVVISDEIHGEIRYKGYQHVPFASISEEFAQNCIVCTAPSKTFNLAGLETSAIIIPNKKIRDNFITSADALPSPNLFGYTALKVAYREGDEWLEQVLEYIQGNYEYLTSYFAGRIAGVKILPAQGTYMVWIDFRGLGMSPEALSAFIKEKAGLELNDGFLFGESGRGFQRMNIACPRSLLEDAVRRIEDAVTGL
jgi:cysteine-S-conjugate beta-lyase